jgi:hypothetical protein
MPRTLRTVRAAWLASVIAPALLANCSSGSSTGDATAGSSNAGSSSAGSSSAGSSSAGSSSAGSSSAGSTGVGGGTSGTCATSDCGPALGIANYQCADGSVAGPTGRCLKRDNGTCGWEILSCPTGSGGAGGAGAGGQASGGAAGLLCGGQACAAEQVCCGPASCGRCISKFSGQTCPALCPGGSGGTGSGGTSGGAGGAACSLLLADVQSTLTAAQGCNTASSKPGLECAGTLEGLCCPVPVEAPTSSNSAANNAYLSALHSYQQSCTHPCPKIACLSPQAGECVAAQGSSLGTCGGGNGL